MGNKLFFVAWVNRTAVVSVVMDTAPNIGRQLGCYIAATILLPTPQAHNGHGWASVLGTWSPLGKRANFSLVHAAKGTPPIKKGKGTPLLVCRVM